MRACCLLGLLALVGCSPDPDPACISNDDCEAGGRCVDGTCIAPTDAGGDSGDADLDAPSDGAADSDCEIRCGEACCTGTERCIADTCVADLGPCESDEGCLDDSYCNDGRCAPYGTPPRGEFNMDCERPVLPGSFTPALQCHWSAPPEGDPEPTFRRVNSTPLVVDFRIDRGPDDPVRPSIVFISAAGLVYGDRGVMRIVDGRTCEDQGVLGNAEDRVGGATTPAVGDLDGDGLPEIVAKSAEGGLIAFEYADGTFRRRWFSTGADGERDRTGGAGAIASLSLADLDDDGRPEIMMGGIVYSPDGVLIDSSLGLMNITGYSQPAVIADIDHDMEAELVRGSGTYDWDRDAQQWALAPGSIASRPDGFVAVADFGEFPDAAGHIPGGAEVGVVSGGRVTVSTYLGEVVFGPIALPGGSHGGNPTVADFDGDGRVELATGGPGSLTVFDLDCQASGATGTCESGRTDGILWTTSVRDSSSGINGSSVFDFEGDGRTEVVYADECFVRVFDGESGEVLWSAARPSATWIEAPIVADCDGDFNAEIIVGGNIDPSCPAIDARHAGLRCEDDGDCVGSCVEGLCRCTEDTECGESGTYSCATPLAGTAGEGNVCRARFSADLSGILVYADESDRWVSSRRVWNQHAYSVTNVSQDGVVPRTSEVVRNWSEPALNDFRKNVQGDLRPLAGPDLTIGRGAFDRTCDPDAPVIPLRSSVCNRGAEPVDSGMVATFFDGDPREGGMAICSATTVRTLTPGMCEEVRCDWDPAPTEGVRDVFLFVDEADDNVECVEGNNIARIASVGCELI